MVWVKRQGVGRAARPRLLSRAGSEPVQKAAEATHAVSSGCLKADVCCLAARLQLLLWPLALGNLQLFNLIALGITIVNPLEVMRGQP